MSLCIHDSIVWTPCQLCCINLLSPMEDLMTETPSTNRLPESLMDSIEELIVAGEYPPGMRLEEIELAATFGVSRTPIREALIRLAATGMIERRPRKGWAVTESHPVACARCLTSWPSWRRCVAG